MLEHAAIAYDQRGKGEVERRGSDDGTSELAQFARVNGHHIQPIRYTDESNPMQPKWFLVLQTISTGC